ADAGAGDLHLASAAWRSGDGPGGGVPGGAADGWASRPYRGNGGAAVGSGKADDGAGECARSGDDADSDAGARSAGDDVGAGFSDAGVCRPGI
ncbi:hypothetical protein EBR96_10675, partial [bacterium]|nr:hypothetical protein [bacterium]